jgi:hypothetical protein
MRADFDQPFAPALRHGVGRMTGALRPRHEVRINFGEISRQELNPFDVETKLAWPAGRALKVLRDFGASTE